MKPDVAILKRQGDILIVQPLVPDFWVANWGRHYPDETPDTPLSSIEPRVVDGCWWIYPGEVDFQHGDLVTELLWDGECLHSLDGKFEADDLEILTEN